MAQTSFSEKALAAAVARLQGLEREIQMAGAYADALQDLLSACLSLRAASVAGKASAVSDALALVAPGNPPVCCSFSEIFACDERACRLRAVRRSQLQTKGFMSRGACCCG